MTAGAEIPKGYKLTEVGVIPEDWRVEALGPHVDIASGESPSRFRFDSAGIPYFKVDQLNNNSKYLSDTPYLIASSRKVVRGSLIFPKRGASILLNKVRVLAADSFMDTNLMALTPKDSVHSEFLFYALTHIELWRIADITSISQINNKHIVPLLVPLPPTKTEQKTIAEALSDADALIESLEQLLAKKRQIKQGAMQELLTGKRRLPGFSGEWDVTTFGDLLRHHSGNSALIKGKLSNLPLAGYFDAYSASGQDVWHHSFENEGHALIVSAVGSRCGKTFKAHGKWSAIANTHVVWPDLCKVDAGFLFLFLNNEDFWLKSGSGQPFVLFKQSFAQELRIPPVTEQTAIAAILSDMDTEIAALETKLAKARSLKQGMMQELLTGRTRLV